MTTVRLDSELEARLTEVVRMTGESTSVFIRAAIAERCDRVLGDRLDRRLADVIGVVQSQGGRARETGDAFVRLLKAQQDLSER